MAPGSQAEDRPTGRVEHRDVVIGAEDERPEDVGVDPVVGHAIEEPQAVPGVGEEFVLQRVGDRQVAGRFCAPPASIALAMVGFAIDMLYATFSSPVMNGAGRVRIPQPLQLRLQVESDRGERLDVHLVERDRLQSLGKHRPTDAVARSPGPARTP